MWKFRHVGSVTVAAAAVIVGPQLCIFLSCQPHRLCHVLQSSLHFLQHWKSWKRARFPLHESIRPKFKLKSLVFSSTHSLNYIILIVGRLRLKPQSLRFPRIRDQAVVCSHSLMLWGFQSVLKYQMITLRLQIDISLVCCGSDTVDCAKFNSLAFQPHIGRVNILSIRIWTLGKLQMWTFFLLFWQRVLQRLVQYVTFQKGGLFYCWRRTGLFYNVRDLLAKTWPLSFWTAIPPDLWPR